MEHQLCDLSDVTRFKKNVTFEQENREWDTHTE